MGNVKMELIGKTKAAFKKVGRQVNAVTAACGIGLRRRQKKREIRRPEIAVVRHGSGELRI